MRYWRERDACSIEIFEQARGMGDPSYNNPLTRLIYRKAAADPALAARMAQAQARQRSPFAMFTPGELLRWVTGAVLSGNIGVVKPFLAAAKRRKTVMAELELRKQLAQEAATLAARPHTPTPV